MQRCYRCEALTDIWTGDIDGKPDRLITTGLLGSIRWWFEVVVRGLEGFACDPSAKSKTCQDDKHCVVCELFGCTGWARKFRFDVLDENDRPPTSQIKKGDRFRLRFTPLRPIRDEEWALLDVTLRLIAGYGAIGGKTVYKPSDEPKRQNAAHHRDYGLVRIEMSPQVRLFGHARLKAYVRDRRWRRIDHGSFAWTSLKKFWCVKGRYLARENSNQSTFNRVIGRPEPKNEANEGDSWLAGRRAEKGGSPESKKVFSFKEPESARRTFGFVRPAKDLDQVRERLRDKAWQDLGDDQFKTGNEILRDLLGKGVGS